MTDYYLNREVAPGLDDFRKQIGITMTKAHAKNG